MMTLPAAEFAARIPTTIAEIRLSNNVPLPFSSMRVIKQPGYTTVSSSSNLCQLPSLEEGGAGQAKLQRRLY